MVVCTFLQLFVYIFFAYLQLWLDNSLHDYTELFELSLNHHRVPHLGLGVCPLLGNGIGSHHPHMTLSIGTILTMGPKRNRTADHLKEKQKFE